LKYAVKYNMTENMHEKYPEYFELGTFNGPEVYV
jgi:hypothetical protein